MSDDTRGSKTGGVSSFVRLAIMLLLGGAVALPFVGPGTSRSPVAESRSSQSASGTAAPKDSGSGADAHTDALVLLGEFVGLDVTDAALASSQKDVPAAGREQLRFDLVRKAFRDRDISVEFVVATVPDPINSNANWTFDPVVGAIARAAAASGFLLDRFFIPDWTPQADAGADASRPRNVHENWPAVVLFRSARFSALATPDKRILVTSLVFETPTAGIHQGAFAEAVRIAQRWDEAAQLRVLGPTFSGAVTSLSNALAAFPGMTFRVVTGSATNPQNISIRRESSPRVTFQSTVLPDDAVVRRLAEYLGQTGSGSDRYALLVEGDTSYGSELKEGSPWPEGTLMLPFPLQISRLRSAATAQAQPGSATNTSRLLGLSLGQSGAPTDQLPSLTPGTTSSAVELELGQILDVITRDHITTVGLLATDTRDKLFLAQQIARRAATVRLFTIEGDLFYVHPDFGQYVRGMIVASSYPLFAQNQAWVDRTPVNQQFSTTMAQGVYNAMVTLLNYDEAGRVREGRTSPGLLDYRLPGGAEREPPVWMSVVGQDALWPVAWFPSNQSGYLQAIDDGSSASQSEPVRAFMSSWMMFGVGVLGAIVFAHAVLYTWRRRVFASQARAWPFFKFFADTGFDRRRPYLFVAFTALAVAWTYVCLLMGLSLRYLEPSPLGWWVDAVGFAVSGGTLAWLLACSVDIARHTALGARRRFANGLKVILQPQYALMLLSLACAVIAAVSGVAYLGSVALHAERSVYYFTRATHPANGVSPATPMVLVITLVYLWSFAHLRRLTAVSGASIKTSLEHLRPLAGGALTRPAADLEKFIDGAVQGLPPALTTAVLAAACVATYLALLHPLSSPEPRWFAYSFRAAWLLLQILLWLAFAHVGYFWHKLRQAMHAFAGTPMIGAFRRLSPEFFHDRLSPRQPDEADMRRMMQTARQLGLALDEMKDTTHTAVRDALLAAVTASGHARPGHQREDKRTKAGGELWAASAEWTMLGVIVPKVASAVADFWQHRARPTALSTIDIDADVKDAKDFKDDMQRWMMRAEDFLAMHVLLVVRELLSRLANVFFYIIVAVMLMVAVQQSFPFQPRQELLGMAWIYVLSAVILVVAILVQMEHDDVLSAFASTASGKVNWDAALWSKIFIYGVIPIATVFAAQFPGIGTTLLDWLTPVQKALP
jgi:hypothetical protein